MTERLDTQLAETLTLEADVLVIGGGPAGAWAAWSAASRGARVVLADKGYLGTSGATAPGGTNVLYLPPDRALRDAAVDARMTQGGYLSERRWIHRVLDTVYESLKQVEAWGYPFPTDEEGKVLRNHLQGPQYMRLMRKVVKQAGVRVLDQSPALELLADADGVGGARGLSRLDNRFWEVRAGAVVIASGGCAFLSKGLGCNVLTGEGTLMAVETGAELSGMEFTRHYAPSAAFGTVTRGLMLGWASFFAEDGTLLHQGGVPRQPDFLAKSLLRGPVYATLDQADTPEKREMLRRAHAIFFVPYDRVGIDPFRDRFPLTLRYEGTVRGTGGIRLTGDDCATTTPGLFAAGDAAAREPVMGGRSGGGAYNAAWAITSGTWAGEGAARFAHSLGSKAAGRGLHGMGRAGLQPPSGGKEAEAAPEIIHAVQNEVFPLEINYFRSESGLTASLGRLNALWPFVYGPAGSSPQSILRAREAAALAATARWSYTAALARKETRGMHTLSEYPSLDSSQQHRLTVTGIETIRVQAQGTLEQKGVLE